jgi:hypothetical protein
MDSIFGRSFRALSVFLAVVTIASVGVLLAWDGNPAMFPPRTHDDVAAFSLAMIAVAYLVYLAARRPPWREVVKALALAIAFLFWAANQYWPNLPQAPLLNDLAIALFVLDVFLVIVGWPRATENGFVEIGGLIGGVVLNDPAPIADEVFPHTHSALVQVDAAKEGPDESTGRKSRTHGDLAGNLPRIVETAGIPRKVNLRMLTLLLGVATGLAGLNYMRQRAKS